MNYSSTFKRSLTDDIVRRISTYYTKNRSFNRKALDQIVTENAFAFTTKADTRRARACKANVFICGHSMPNPDNPRPYQDVGFEFTEFDHIIRAANSKVYGSKWQSPSRREQLPFVAVFLDFAGSRYALEAPSLNEIQDLHLHGLIAYPPSHIDRAHEVIPNLMNDVSTKHRLLFDRVTIEPFDPARATTVRPDQSALANYLEYAMKGAAHLMATPLWSGDTYRLYPNPAGGGYNYPRPPAGSADRRVPFEAAFDLTVGAE